MSLIPLRRNRVKGYRLTCNGIGIYEALKKEMFNKTHTPDAWIEFKNSPECNWLPLPPTYGDNNASYFTEVGYNKFMELTMPIVNEYISSEDIETEVSDIPSNAIVYKDEYQFVIDTTKQEWDHDNHPYSFDNPNIYMRPAAEDDVDNMYSWEIESIDKSLQEDPKVQQLIRDDCYQSIKDTQMIMDQDKTIGMFTACMIDNGEWRYIGEIYLIPEYRGQHIGSTILKNEIANYDRIRLQVAYDNENALRLYKSLGFKIVKENKEAKLYIMEYDKSVTVQEAVLKAKDKEKLKDSAYGIPELRKFPLTNKNGDYDENHIRMAVKFFGSAPKKYKKELAKRILRAAHSIDLDTEKWDTINKALKNHKESVVHEGFVDRTIKHTLSGLKIPKLQPVDEKYLMDHKADYMKLYADRGSVTASYYNLHYDTFEKTFGDKAEELYDALENLFAHIGFAKDFNIYNKYRLFLCRLLNMPTNHVIALEGWYNRADMGQMRVKAKEDDEGIPLKSTDVLYHTSKIKGLTELQPTFVSRNAQDPFDFGKKLLSLEALYTSPRVYVGLNEPVGREGLGTSGLRIYKITNFKGKVKYDHELTGGAARFIETRSPVKVQDVTEEYLSKHIKEASTIQEGFFEVGFGNLRKTVADKLGKFVTVTNVQNPTGKEAKFVIKSNEHPEDYVNVIAMGNGVKAYGYKDSERVSIFNNASLSAAIQKLIDSVCDLFDIQKPINESYTERKNFIMKEQITKILEAYNSGVLTQEEASEKIEAIQEGAYLQKLKDMANNWDEDYFQAYSKVVDDAYKEVKYGPDGKPEDPAKYDDWIKKSQFLKNMKALRPKHFEFRNAKEHDDYYNKIAHGDSERAKEMVNNTDAKRNKYANSVTQAANNNESDSVLGIRESAIMSDLRVKQDKIMESFKMGIINATEGMRLIERVMMEADYITEEEDTAYEGDDDNEPEDITPEDTDGDTVDSDDTNIDALADYINSLSDDEKTALMSKLSGSDEPTDDDANGNEEVPTDDASAEGEPTTEETVDPASVSDASLNDANASLDDMEV